MNTETEPIVRAEPSVVDLIDAIEGMVVSGRRVPFSANVVVNEDETLELIDRARLGLPTELVRARHTLGEREHIIEDAEGEAKTILDAAQKDAHALIVEAQERATRLVAEHEILRTAQERADTIVIEAEDRAEATRAEADTYAREVMEELDNRLTKSLATVRKGLETLPKLRKQDKKRKH